MLYSPIKKDQLSSWEQLCIFNQNHFEHPHLKFKMNEIKDKEPSYLVPLLRWFMNFNKKDEAWAKFSRITWQQAVDIMYDFSFRTQKDLKEPSKAFVKPFRINRFHGQQPCSYLTAKKRVDLISTYCTKDDHILILGDDDHIGLFLAREGFKNVVSLDIDPYICRSLEQSAKKENLPLQVIHHDANKKPAEAWQKNYKMIMIDPMYSIDGVKLFLSAAMDFAEKSQVSTIYFVNLHLLSLLPPGLEEFDQYVNQLDLEVLNFYPALNRYPIPYFLKLLLNLFNRRCMRVKKVLADSGRLDFFLSDAIILQKKLLQPLK